MWKGEYFEITEEHADVGKDNGQSIDDGQLADF